MDIALVVDSSARVPSGGSYQQVTNFFDNLVRILQNIGTGSSQSQVAQIRISTNPTSPDWYLQARSQNDVLSLIGRYAQRLSGDTNIADTLYTVYSEIYRSDRDRPSLPNVVVVVLGGDQSGTISNSEQLDLSAVSSFLNNIATVIVVSVGASDSTLRVLTNQITTRYIQTTYNNLPSEIYNVVNIITSQVQCCKYFFNIFIFYKLTSMKLLYQ